MSSDADVQLPRVGVSVSTATNCTTDPLKRLRESTAAFLQSDHELCSLPNWPADVGVVNIGIGTEHLGILFEDGRVARVKYELVSSNVAAAMERNKKKESAPSNDTNNTVGHAPTSTEGRINRFGSIRLSSASNPTLPQRPFQASIFGSDAQPSRGADPFRMPRRSNQTPRRSVSVPEELVQGVMEVLPNKSRSTIIRQLQKTGLDVDSAIGLLLSNGDEDGDDDDDDDDDGNDDQGDPEEDHIVEHDVEMANAALASDGFASHQDQRGSAAADRAERDLNLMQMAQRVAQFGQYSNWSSFGSMMEREAAADVAMLRSPTDTGGTTGPRRSLSERTKDLARLNSITSTKGDSDSSIMKPLYRLLGELKFAGHMQRFKSMCALHSTMLLVPQDENGLWKWNWADEKPVTFERSSLLSIENERIRLISGCPFRAVLYTESQKLVSIVDDTCDYQEADRNKPRVLEHPATAFQELSGDQVVELSVSGTMTVARTQSGKVYWWGLLPLHVREANAKKIIRSRKALSKSNFTLHVGDKIQLRSSPLYRPGAIGYNPIPGAPKIGRLLDTAWNLTDKCRFQPLAGVNRKGGESSEGTGPIVEWRLDDIIFLRQGCATQVGTVLKVDGPHCAVYFEDPKYPLQAVGSERDALMWQNSRLFKTDELGPVVENDAMDFIEGAGFVQHYPELLPTRGFVSAAAILNGSFHILSQLFARNGQHFEHVPEMFHLSQYCEVGWKQSTTLQELQVMMLPGYRGLRSRPLWFCGSTSCGTAALVDDEGSIIAALPFDSKTQNFGSRPQLSQIPAIHSISVGFTQHNFDTNNNSGGIELAITMCRAVLLLPVILERNLRKVKATLKAFQEYSWKTVLQERLDGGRNILHSLVTVSKDAPEFACDCAVTILQSPWLATKLADLLCHLDACGRTPIMAAVHEQQHKIATVFMGVISKASANDSSIYENALAKHNQITGQTILHALTSEEMCTYDRTGPTHVAQEVFECRTCNLVDEYCLCFACAAHCHLGHDVRYKGRAPSSYCDCKEKKCCTSFAPCSPSTMKIRSALTDQLMQIDAVVSAVSFDGETVLMNLMSQISVAEGFSRNCSPPNLTNLKEELNERQRVLLALCKSWISVKSTILIGSNLKTETFGNIDGDDCRIQDSTVKLDSFMFNLCNRNAGQYLTQLLSTITSRIASDAVANSVASRLVRSAVRVYSTLSSGEPEAHTQKHQIGSSSNRVDKSTCGTEYKNNSPRLKQCRKVFQAFPAIAIQELAECADAIIAPVRVGLVRPGGTLSPSATGKHESRNKPRYETNDPNDIFSPLVVGLPPTNFARSQWGLQQTKGENDEMKIDEPNKFSNVEVPLAWATRHHRSSVQNSTISESGRTVRSADSYSSLGPRGSRGRVAEASPQTNEEESQSITDLARLHSRLVKEMVDLWDQFASRPDHEELSVSGPTPEGSASDVNKDQLKQATEIMDLQLERCWNWLAPAMDAMESQLRAGIQFAQAHPCAIIASGINSREGSTPGTAPTPSFSRNPSGQTGSRSHMQSIGHLDFRRYLLSLMRAHSGEHGGCLPELDVSRTKHLAHVLDGISYYLRVRSLKKPEHDLSSHERFFMRSESIVESGSVVSPVFTTSFHEALPLAERPDRLRPSSSRTSLFGKSTEPSEKSSPSPHLGLSNRLSPMKGVSRRGVAGNNPECVCEYKMTREFPALQEVDTMVVFERWRNIVQIFVSVFLHDVGSERESFILGLAGFKVKESRFREKMERLLRTVADSSSTDLKLTGLVRDRKTLLSDIYTKFNAHLESKRQKQLPFLCRSVKVEFKNEPGEGSGVLRSLLASLAEALLKDELLPSAKSSSSVSLESMFLLAVMNDGPHGGFNGVPSPLGDPLSQGSAGDDYNAQLRPLFHAPGNLGYVAPVYNSIENDKSTYRLDWFRNAGILIGLSILYQHVLPMNLCRHVLKYLLGRKIAWHDLAFFDSSLYESMRKTIVGAMQQPPEVFSTWELYFCVSLPDWLGSGTHNLVPLGEKLSVTRENVHEYVARYSQFIMVESVQPALEAMRKGLLLVIPQESLVELTAEDLRLLLNGCSDIDIRLLKQCTEFKNETGKDVSHTYQTQQWFWEVIETMTDSERHDLVYFWTSSPGLPATEAGLVPKPSVVVRPASEGNDGMLPTANTCTSRLSLPVYPTVKILKEKLLTAIQVKTFGFV